MPNEIYLSKYLILINLPQNIISITSMSTIKTLLIFTFAIIAAIAINPPSWGGNPVYTVRVEMLNNAPVAKWNFTYYYNSNLKA